MPTETKIVMDTPSAYSVDQQFFATRYKQGERTVFGLALSPGELTSVVAQPDPAKPMEGNRKIRASHADGFADYFIENDNWVIPGIILRAPSIFQFEEKGEIPNAQFGQMSYPKRQQGEIHILDGQHRILGFFLALEKLNKRIEKARDAKAKASRAEGPDSRAVADIKREIAHLEAVVARFYSQRVSVEIQVTDSLSEARQMFVDIADNALSITASTRARFDTRKVINRALPIVLEHPLLVNRVDIDLDRVQAQSPFWLSAKQVIEDIRVTRVGFEGRISRRQNDEWKDKDAEIARITGNFFTMLSETMPPLFALQNSQITAPQLRSTMLLGNPTFIRILAGVNYELAANRGWAPADVKAFFSKLAPHAATRAHANSIWQLYTDENSFGMNALGPNGQRAALAGLVKTITGWALDRPDFLEHPPLDPPAPEVDPDEGLDFALGHDTKALQVEERNAIEDIAAQSKARSTKA